MRRSGQAAGGGSGRTPLAQQKCSICGQTGHKKTRHAKLDALAAKAEKRKPERRAALRVGDRFLVIENFVEEDPRNGGPWRADEEFEIVEVLGERVEGYELCALRSTIRPLSSIGLPQLYPFQRRPPDGAGFDIPRIGMGQGLKTVPAEVLELPAPDADSEPPAACDSPEEIAAARDIPAIFRQRVRERMAERGESWNAALRAVLAREARGPLRDPDLCYIRERFGRPCRSCRPSRQVAAAG